MAIDLESLWILVGLTAFLSGIGNVIISNSNLQVKGIGYWAIFSFLFATAIAFSSTGNIVDIARSPDLVPFSDFIFVTAFTSLYIGVREVKNKQTHPWLLIGGLWVAAVCLIYFATTISVETNLELSVFSLYVAIISIMCIYELYKDISYQSKGQISLLVIFICVVLFMICKIAAQYGYDLTKGSEGYLQWLLATGLVMQICLIWFIFSVVLIVADKLQTEISESGHTDHLTGLLNQKGIEDTAERVLKRNQRTQTPVTLLMIDVDFFREMNDTYGYLFANAVLQRVGILIEDTLRFEDFCARYQADVFILILEGSSEEGVLLPAQRILNSLDEYDLNIDDTLVPCTVSIGIATSTGGKDFYDLVQLAHEALLEVKSQGGNGLKVSGKDS